jgi:hypothetical protein
MSSSERVDIEEITLSRNGEVFIKLSKKVLNGEQVLFSEPHRGTITPGMDATAYLSTVNKHLNAMGFPDIASDGILTPSKIVDAVQEYHTPERIAEYRERAKATPPTPQ